MTPKYYCSRCQMDRGRVFHKQCHHRPLWLAPSSEAGGIMSQAFNGAKLIQEQLVHQIFYSKTAESFIRRNKHFDLCTERPGTQGSWQDTFILISDNQHPSSFILCWVMLPNGLSMQPRIMYPRCYVGTKN